MRVLVVGGGIMGLACAWACARAGHRVDLVEQGPLPNPLASSWDASRLIRYPYGDKANYAAMVRHAFAANDRLFAELGRRPYVETGTLVVGGGRDPTLDAVRASLEALEVRHAALDASALAARYPLLRADPERWGLWTPTGGVLLAAALLDALVAWLTAHERVHLYAPHRVVAVDGDRGEVALADGARLAADRLVVAAGPWTADLVPDLAPRAVPSRQLVVEVETDAERRRAWSRMPMVLDGIAAAGSGFYAVPPVAGLAIKTGDHSFSRTGHPDCDREAAADERARILALFRAGVRDAAAYRVRTARTCFYTLAPEERFVVEERGAALLLAGFSGHGFKFGPLVGLAVAGWLEARIATPELAAWLGGRMPQPPAALDRDLRVTSAPGLR